MNALLAAYKRPVDLQLLMIISILPALISLTMKSNTILLLCALMLTNQTNAQSQTDVSAWLTETTINGRTLQILRAPQSALKVQYQPGHHGYSALPR